MINFDKEFLRTYEPDFLPESGTVSGKQTYVCPECGNGSGNNKTGIIRYGNENRYKCFSCDGNFDIIDLAMKENNMEWEEAVKWLCDRYSVDYSENSRKKNEEKAKIVSPEINYSKYIEQAKMDNNYEYLQSRGISKEIQDKFNIGYVEKWRNPKAPSTVPYTPRCIIPTSDYSYLARDVRPDNEINEIQKKFIKTKVGKVHIFNEDELNNATDNYLFITEGEIDAMSIEELGYPAIGLGSAANKDMLVDLMVENKCFWKTIFIIGDSDITGRIASTSLKNELIKKDCCELAVMLDIPYKDPNEFLINDRKGFEKFLSGKLHEHYRRNIIYVDDERMRMLEDMSKILEAPVEDILELTINSYSDKLKQNTHSKKIHI